MEKNTLRDTSYSPPGTVKPVVVEGFGDASAQPKPEGFSGGAAPTPLPEGFAGTRGGKPDKVDGFGGTTGSTAAPPVEGFGDSADNKGLNATGAGYLDQEEEPMSPQQEEVDIGPEGEEEYAQSSTETSAPVDMEPGWQEAANSSYTTGNIDRGGEEAEGEETLDPDGSIWAPAGKRPFTAQLKAVGYGGFHEWQMNFLKNMIEKRGQRS